ncbi:MAG: hypothetical protein IPJ76_18740 [Flavobacteriales bacterium]|nr:MAG: hypothetical protein IPJ76_18740 [Flavobacteriales bacterium]
MRIAPMGRVRVRSALWCARVMAGSVVGWVSLFEPFVASGQRSGAAAGSLQWADSALHALVEMAERAPRPTLGLTEELMAVYAKAEDSCGLSHAQAFRCTSFDQLGAYDSAMVAAQAALRLFHQGCDSMILMRTYLGFSNMKLSLSENADADSLCTYALRHWNPAWPVSPLRSALLTNRAIAKASGGDLQGAMNGFKEVLALAREEGNDRDVDDALSNIGVLKAMVDELDSSDHYFNIALEAARSKGNKSRVVKQLMNLADNQRSRGQHRSAIALFDSALVLSRSTGDLREEAFMELQVSRSFTELGEHALANERLYRHLVLNDSLLNLEKVRSLAEVQEKYESEKKANEIKELQVQKLDADLRAEKVRRMRNVYLFSAVVVLGLAVGLWYRLRFTRRSRAAIQKEKDISEGLLLNILPLEVADELKAKGYADAREFETATILFTDFKGFTELSEKLSPAGLIDELNLCFKAFDRIMEQYNIEKIKTIGDAYMAAGGLPDPAHGPPGDVLCAALDMQDFMVEYGRRRSAEGAPFFSMRLGLHTGTVIAGIVGVKKFAYDIWGDAVNTASRMESSGEVGRVNISQSTYERVKDDRRFRFIARGLVAAKGKGELEMWFAERAT